MLIWEYSRSEGFGRSGNFLGEWWEHTVARCIYHVTLAGTRIGRLDPSSLVAQCGRREAALTVQADHAGTQPGWLHQE